MQNKNIAFQQKLSLALSGSVCDRLTCTEVSCTSRFCLIYLSVRSTHSRIDYVKSSINRASVYASPQMLLAFIKRSVYGSCFHEI